MARAHATAANDIPPGLLEGADEVMMLLITGVTWQTLVRQGAAEGISPGEVFGKALRLYLEAHGSPGVVEFLYAASAASKAER